MLARSDDEAPTVRGVRTTHRVAARACPDPAVLERETNLAPGHEGAGRENSFGVNIVLPFESGSPPGLDGDPKLINFRYFFSRKLMFMKESHGYALFPGGFGTLDETFELLTLMQTGRTYLAPVVMLDADTWSMLSF